MPRPVRCLLPLALLAGLLAAPSAGAAGPTGDPSRWTDRQLAAQLVLAGYDMARVEQARAQVAAGLGGVVLFGTPPRDLRARLARVRAAGSVVPLVASDEEGGRVQRLRGLLGALPSAETMGRTRTPAQVRALARSYGAGMRGLGVDLDLAPVADLSVPGAYVEQTDRAFARDPARVGAYASAWHQGMRDSRVAAVAKHWPGHGAAGDTHQRAARTAALATMERREMVPFARLLRDGVPSVMVGHLEVPGLTEPGVPASLSPRAYAYLRQRAGERLLVTDSLDMGAVRSGAGLTRAQAAVRALRAGADAVLVDPGGALPVDAVAAALRDGRYPRAAAVRSVRRLLAVKRLTNPPHVPSSLRASGGAVSAVVTGPVPGRDTARFFVRTAGARTWDVANGGQVPVSTGSRAAYRPRLRPATRYAWTVRACNAAGLCSPAAPERSFTTPADTATPTVRTG